MRFDQALVDIHQKRTRYAVLQLGGVLKGRLRLRISMQCQKRNAEVQIIVREKRIGGAGKCRDHVNGGAAIFDRSFGFTQHFVGETASCERLGDAQVFLAIEPSRKLDDLVMELRVLACAPSPIVNGRSAVQNLHLQCIVVLHATRNFSAA